MTPGHSDATTLLTLSQFSPMSTHLAHKLPWTALTEIAVKRAAPPTDRASHVMRITRKQLRAVHHFARCFQSALKEFAETDRTETPELDPSTWGIEVTGFGGYLGYHYSLLWGYVTLNLILAEPKHANAIAESNRHVLDVLCGYSDGGHPDHMAERLRGAFGEYRTGLKPLTADVAQILREHAALLFKCMHKISGENRYLLQTDEDLADTMFYAVGFYTVEDE